ncbi:MAG: thioredoxin [Chitinophagaceae bacterium]|nr:thioredoxin [Chitinophagaceae bacterium]MBL0129852.1 thioredoxin [Chitinophagaceae bacterium]MBL0273376.1 thioredoxin [Chitinophagaceae bacterium]
MKNVNFLFLFSSFLACNGQEYPSTKIGPEDFEKAIAGSNIQLLDVRTSAEYKTGHIKNALQADWTNSKQFNERIQFVDKDKPVYIYCLVGGRSASAADWMRQNGFKTVVELQGGINAWKKAERPLEGSSNEIQMTLEQYLASIPKEKTTLVDFGAEWCPPCVKMAPLVNDLQNNKKLNFLLIKIDAGIHTNLMKALNIEPIPVFIIYKKGKEVWRKEGIVSREEFLAQLN